MITIAKYDSLEEAQRAASYLTSKGIDVETVLGGDGNVIAGSGTAVELMIKPDDLPHFEYLTGEDDFEEYFDSRIKCPKCDSANTENKNGFLGFIPLVLNAFSGGQPKDEPLIYSCKNCGANFKD